MPDLKDFPDVTQMAIPFFVVAILIEVFVIRYLKGRGDYETRDTTTSLLMGVGNVASGLLLGFIAFGVLMWAWQFRIVDLGSSWWVIALCFVLDDLRYYWYHRIAHRCRWVWAEHVIHHSSQHYNLSTALRQSWTGTFTGMFILRIPLALIGFHPVLLLFVGGLNLVYQFWIHTETIGRMWRPIEWIFNTPSHHRVHHATNPRYLDSNYAGTLIIWDRMFGTFVPELDEDMPRYGIVKNIGTFNPVRVAFHEWIDMFRDAMRPGLSIRQRLSYLFAPPGWSHDGSRKGSELLKADYVALNPETAGTPGLPPGLPGAARGASQTAQTGVAAAE
jgi:sterol desaturase/sphingolipid hydroxylase (fatty acid hydroxylase superfamily)